MYKLCIFAGTTEGRQLVETLRGQAVQVTACVATDYGETLLEPDANLTVSAKRLTPEQMVHMMEENRFDLVLDATHPYAQAVTENICSACETTQTEYLRVLRSASDVSTENVCVPDIASAVAYLNTTEGTILLTTGSKELKAFTAIRSFEERVYARVLPMDASLQACQEAGLKPAHIIAMQGPFSEEMNTALIRYTNAAYLVTKDGGDKGGFIEKAEAARKEGVQMVVIGRPEQRAGMSLSETICLLETRFGIQTRPKVTIVGIGPGSHAAMTQEVQQAIAGADCLIGAKRMLASTVTAGQYCCDAIAPKAIAECIAAHREFQRFTIVMSGDSGFYSGTKKLIPLLKNCELKVLPGLSSMSYLCGRLGTSYEDVKPVSLHGRDHDIIRDVQSNGRVFTLVGGENGMKDLCASLCDAGLGNVHMSVGERLSYPDEKISTGTAESLCGQKFDTLCVALIENADPCFVVTHGLQDELFLRGEGRDGVVPMTKREVRSISLSMMQLTQNAICWDIGAGTGSVSIEMALQCGEGSVYAIERKEDAVQLLTENKKKFHADNLHIVAGYAPEACEDLPAPTHAFIGGSAGNMQQIIDLLLKKNPNVRIVATAIALETVAELTQCMKLFSFTTADVQAVQIARSRKAGPYHLMSGNNPVYIFTMQK